MESRGVLLRRSLMWVLSRIMPTMSALRATRQGTRFPHRHWWHLVHHMISTASTTGASGIFMVSLSKARSLTSDSMTFPKRGSSQGEWRETEDQRAERYWAVQAFTA